MSSTRHVREIAEFVERLMASTKPDTAAGKKLGAWLREHESLLGLPNAVPPAVKRKNGDEKPFTLEQWRALRRRLAACAKQRPCSQVAENARALGEALKLSPNEIAIFVVVAMADHESLLERLFVAMMETRSYMSVDIVSVCAGIPAPDVAAILLSSTLTGLRLVDGTGERPGKFDLYVPYAIGRALRPPVSGLAAIERHLVGPALVPKLREYDFDHLARERDFVERLLGNAARQRVSGINILLYGPPGTGKTEFAKLVTHAAGLKLFAIGEDDDYGDEPSREDRLSAYRIGERLLSPHADSCLLFDEMEDILQRGDVSYINGRRIRRSGSKVFFNRLLERNNVPVIWTANVLDEFDPAFLRRMGFALEMKPLPVTVRARLWTRSAERRGLALAPELADGLARAHRVSPGVAEGAIATVVAAGAGADQLDFVTSNLARASIHDWRQPKSVALRCDVTLLNADRDLAALERQLGAAGPKDVSFCFYGPPGTGKSAFARRLAENMQLEPLEKRGSDLLSKWVGETEKLIAEAFAEAARDKAFLIIDEAEGLILNRGRAERSWEVSMANEFLTALESHAFPVACTTNHLDRLDPAAVRRFTFKIRFDELRPEQATLAFERFFGVVPPAPSLARSRYTLGDFATVKKQLRLMGQPAVTEIVALLDAEAAVRPGAPRAIGFRV